MDETLKEAEQKAKMKKQPKMTNKNKKMSSISEIEPIHTQKMCLRSNEHGALQDVFSS